MNQDGSHGATALVQRGFDNNALCRAILHGRQFKQFGLQQNSVQQFVNALFPEDAMRIRDERSPTCDEKVCTMCGEFCANRASTAIFEETLSASHKA